MSRVKNNLILVLFLSFVFAWYSDAQTLKSFGFRYSNGLEIASIGFEESDEIVMTRPMPLFSFLVNGRQVFSSDATVRYEGNIIRYMFKDGIIGTFKTIEDEEKGWKGILHIQNHSTDTLRIENVVPFGAYDDHVYLTAEGPPGLARSHLYLPGKKPVRVILPDNAWELGYASIQLDNNYSVCAFCRRTAGHNAVQKRFYSLLSPNASIEYTFFADLFQGKWQNGLKLMFRDRYLGDLEGFDNSLYEREDLKWIRDKYLIALQFAWDKEFYDSEKLKFRFPFFLDDAQKKLGGYDIFGIWPGWPRLGVDQRNQWEMYEDLPFGLPKLKELSIYARTMGTSFFISYNPWDNSTTKADHLQEMARIIKEVDADGVVLDTRGSSSRELQETADMVKPGVIMYSEGMAVPKDMPGIVAGRVHNAIERSPILNLNKLIKPDFAIFRVIDLSRGSFERDIAISFFNGYGTEINYFRPGRPDWMDPAFKYLGKTLRILRENSSVFHDHDWTPLITTLKDNIWVNEWKSPSKSIYTVLNMDPEGYTGPLFEVKASVDHHFVSLWNHMEVSLVKQKTKYFISVDASEFNKNLTGTNQEGSIECIVRFPKLLKCRFNKDSLMVTTTKAGQIRIWESEPSYASEPAVFESSHVAIRLRDHFNKTEGRFIIQLVHDGELLDECVVEFMSGMPYLVSSTKATKRVKKAPRGMLEVDAGSFMFSVSNPDQFIPYPDYSTAREMELKRFFIDKYPVTNQQFLEFMQATLYSPEDSKNFLKHWEDGTYPQGQAKYPVVYIDIEDARTYAEWAGKRLPTEIEWQYAAQGNDSRTWPWGTEFHGTKCNNSFGRPTPVDAFSKGESPFKVADMVGNVWQLTNDVYDNGSYRFVIIRGGSYYNPESSIWYVKGGPQPLDHTQMLLLVSPGFNRNATVGFRCVKDAE